MKMELLDTQAAGLYGEMLAFKEDLHRHPESSFQERRTTELLKEKLAALGLCPVDMGMDTGVVAVLEGERHGKTAALRADIDAIAQTENQNHVVRSETAGLMHGCGHDFHTACLYGAAKLLSARKETLSGRVAFLFQPAEEETQGARTLLDHGLWERMGGKPDCIFGLHNRPELPAGQIAVRNGPIMAGKINFRVILRGRPGHGGSPHKCVDPVVAGAALIDGVQTIVSRSTDPQDALVCAVYSVHTDAPDFFVPSSLSVTGSIRYLRDAAGQRAAQRLRDLAAGVAAAYECQAETQLLPQVPVTRNAASLAEIAECAAAETAGAENVACPPPDMGSEDFAVYGQEVPAFFYWLGSGFPGRENAPWHSPDFRTNDAALPLGAALLARSALLALERL
ncbi:M20 family metallopeptidase [Oscillibacter valericigenes]|nr:M20 family metallopeptidase [Oscillibacter valericigenes]